MTRQALLELFERAAAQVTEREQSGLAESMVISALGIDSLGLLELVGEMERALGLHLPDDQLVGLATVQYLLDLVERRSAAAA